MYFKRWGLLAPPPGKASFLKDLPALLSPYKYYASNGQEVTSYGVRSAGVQACKKLPVTTLSTKAHDT